MHRIMNSPQIIFLVGAFALSLLIGCHTSKEKADLIVEQEPAQVHPSLQMLPVPGGLGVNIHFYKGNEKDLLMLSEANIGIVRMDVSWGGVEKSPGEYDFSQLDLLISDLEQHNIRLMFIIDYGNALYDEGLAPHTNEGRAAYARFCTELAKRYAGKNIVWELWNEPNIDPFWKPHPNVDDYMAWCKAVVPAIREVDPNACIIGPATSGFDLSFLESCFKQGLLELIDGISVHPYRNVRLGPETAADEYNILSTLIEQYKPEGEVISIISGEWGYSTTHLSQELQGKYLVRQWLSNMAHNIPISIWYDWHDDGQNPQNAEHNFGTVTWDYQPKPAYIAMKTLISQLNGFMPIGRIGMGDMNDYVVVFRSGDQVKLAIWTTTQPHEIDFRADLKVANIVDYMGRSCELPKKSKLLVDNGPRYLNLTTTVPMWLKMIIQASQLSQIEIEKIVQSLFEESPCESYAEILLNAIENGQELERKAALHVLVQLADRLDRNQPKALKLYHMVLKNDADVCDIKQALNGVTSIGSLESMEVVAPLFQNPLFIQEAANYYLQVAFKLAEKKDFTDAEKLLMKAAGVSSQRYLVDRVFARMKEMGKETNHPGQIVNSAKIGFINHWWVAGPFPNKGDIAERTAYFPEKRIDFSQVETFDTLTARWREIELDGIYPIIPFAELFGREQRAAYAYTEANIPNDMAVKFKIGSNDGIVCWLNNQKIHENLIGRKLTVDEDIVDAHFKKGMNRILLKIPNKGANWEACLRVCNQNGIPLDLNKHFIEPHTE